MEINILFHDLQDWPGELPQLGFPKTVPSDLKLLISFQRPTVKLSIWKKAEFMLSTHRLVQKGSGQATWQQWTSTAQPLPEKDCLKMGV